MFYFQGHLESSLFIHYHCLENSHVKAAGHRGQWGREVAILYIHNHQHPQRRTGLRSAHSRQLFLFLHIFSFLQTLGYCPFRVFANSQPKTLTLNLTAPVFILLLSLQWPSKHQVWNTAPLLLSYIMYSSSSLLQATLLVDILSTTYRHSTENLFSRRISLLDSGNLLLLSM